MVEYITAEELNDFFPNAKAEQLKHLSERINWWCNQALGLIESEENNIKHRGLYDALRTIKVAKIPKLIGKTKEGCRQYDSEPLTMQEEIEKIQAILKSDCCYFPKEIKKSNQVVPSILKDVFVSIYFECEKITKLSWYSEGESVGEFEGLIRFIRDKMKNESIGNIPDTSITDWLKKSTKPKYHKEIEFSNFMKERLGNGKHKMRSIKFQNAYNDYKDSQ